MPLRNERFLDKEVSSGGAVVLRKKNLKKYLQIREYDQLFDFALKLHPFGHCDTVLFAHTLVLIRKLCV